MNCRFQALIVFKNQINKKMNVIETQYLPANIFLPFNVYTNIANKQETMIKSSATFETLFLETTKLNCSFFRGFLLPKNVFLID